MARHKSKHYVVILDDAVSTTPFNVDLYAVQAFHSTWLGGHIQLTVTNDNSATNSGFFMGAVIIIRDGQSLNAYLMTNGSKFYTPEEDVLWSTAIYFDEAQDATLHFNEPLSAQRKLNPGDKIT